MARIIIKRNGKKRYTVILPFEKIITITGWSNLETLLEIIGVPYEQIRKTLYLDPGDKIELKSELKQFREIEKEMENIDETIRSRLNKIIWFLIDAIYVYKKDILQLVIEKIETNKIRNINERNEKLKEYKKKIEQVVRKITEFESNHVIFYSEEDIEVITKLVERVLGFIINTLSQFFFVAIIDKKLSEEDIEELIQKLRD